MTPEPIENESLLWRPPPLRPYQPGTTILEIPRQALSLMLTILHAYASRRVEACCFLYGATTADNAHATVEAVVVPRQSNSWGHYTVEADAIPRIAAATRPRGWRNLAQVHTHPGIEVEHSRYDDLHANSRRALSFVVPLYGLWASEWPDGIGVHEFQNDYWYRLSDEHAQGRTQLTDARAVLVDTRP